MKRKIIFCLNFLWASFIAFSFPICLGGIYMDITGHAKGYAYDLGSEKDISILFGCIELMIWFILAFLSNIYIFKRIKAKGICYVIMTIIFFVILFFLCIHLIGGWNEFGRFFHS
jgi:hypothetical protein